MTNLEIAKKIVNRGYDRFESDDSLLRFESATIMVDEITKALNEKDSLNLKTFHKAWMAVSDRDQNKRVSYMELAKELGLLEPPASFEKEKKE